MVVGVGGDFVWGWGRCGVGGGIFGDRIVA